MIKFFRKIRYNLMEQNKNGKYLKYAIGEIVLVVIGILIALSINNWNEERKDRIEELVALKDLKKEFETNRFDIDSLFQFKKMMIRNWDSYLTTVSNRELHDSVRSISRPSIGFKQFYFSSTILNSILTTGKIDKIQNDSLKYLLTIWNDVLSDLNNTVLMQQNYAPKFLEIESKLLPNTTVKLITNTSNYFYTEDEIKELNLISIEDKEYQYAMVYNLHTLKLQERSTYRLKVSIDRVINLLEKEISNRTQ